MKHLFLGFALVTAAFGADLTYTETMTLTGGSMKTMLGLASRLGGQNLTKGVTSTVVVSGGKMSNRSGDDATIMDADAGTMTIVDYKGKKYSTITFEELLAAYEQMPQMAAAQANQKDDVNSKTEIKVSADGKGAGPTIAGVTTNRYEILVVSNTTFRDEKKKEEATLTTTMKLDQAMGKPQGWDAVRDFYKRLSAKMPMRPDPAAQMMRQTGLSVEAMNEAAKKLGSMDGMAMRSVMQTIGPGEAAPQVEMPTGKEVAQSALKGITGGFGGFGRRNNKKEETKAKEEAKAPAGPNILLEFTTEVQSIRPGVADAQAFVIPAGFKQEEHPLKRYAQKKK